MCSPWNERAKVEILCSLKDRREDHVLLLRKRGTDQLFVVITLQYGGLGHHTRRIFVCTRFAYLEEHAHHLSCLGYWEVPHHVCEFVRRRPSNQSFHYICHGCGAHVYVSLLSRIVVFSTTLVSLPTRIWQLDAPSLYDSLCFVKAATYSFDCGPIRYELVLVLKKETHFLPILYTHCFEE